MENLTLKIAEKEAEFDRAFLACDFANSDFDAARSAGLSHDELVQLHLNSIDCVDALQFINKELQALYALRRSDLAPVSKSTKSKHAPVVANVDAVIVETRQSNSRVVWHQFRKPMGGFGFPGVINIKVLDNRGNWLFKRAIAGINLKVDGSKVGTDRYVEEAFADAFAEWLQYHLANCSQDLSIAQVFAKLWDAQEVVRSWACCLVQDFYKNGKPEIVAYRDFERLGYSVETRHSAEAHLRDLFVNFD